MIYVSEYTGKHYATEQECVDADKQYEEARTKEEVKRKAKNEARAKAAKEVEDAAKAVHEAKKNYYKVLADFCNEYGNYHYSFTTPTNGHSLLDIFDLF